MKKSISLLSLVFCLCVNHSLVSAVPPMQPIERTVGKLHISIDPRMELLAAIHSLSSNNDLIERRNLLYCKELTNYFTPYSSHKAVKQTENLRQKYGFSYDAPVCFMLHLSQPLELDEETKFSDYLLMRSGKGNHLKQYRKSIKQFAEVANFEEFWNGKIPFYNQILDTTIADIGNIGRFKIEIDLVKALEDYFNESLKSYNVTITPAFSGGKAAFVGKDFYITVATEDKKNNIPYVSGQTMLGYVWHEFGHSFVNPLTEKYASRVDSLSKLFEPIKEVMSKQAYGYWPSCVNEHIIRATTIRMVEAHINAEGSKRMLNNELRQGFMYIKPLVEKLKEFEKQRDENRTTFSEFYPELLNTLDSLQKVE